MFWHKSCWIRGKNSLSYLSKMKDRLAQLKEVGSRLFSVMHQLLSNIVSTHC